MKNLIPSNVLAIPRGNIKEEKFPIGDSYQELKHKRYQCTWDEEDNFYIFMDAKWQEAESIDFNFDNDEIIL